MDLRLIDAASVHRLLDHAPGRARWRRPIAARRRSSAACYSSRRRAPAGSARASWCCGLGAWPGVRRQDGHDRAANAEIAGGPPTVQAVYQLFEARAAGRSR